MISSWAGHQRQHSEESSVKQTFATFCMQGAELATVARVPRGFTPGRARETRRRTSLHRSQKCTSFAGGKACARVAHVGQPSVLH